MTEEKIEKAVTEAMNPETFDVLDYLDNSPIATDEVTIYTNVPACKEIVELMDARGEVIEARRLAEKKGASPSLSLTDEDEDTEFDDRINELVEIREKTRLIFKLKSVAPALEKAIKKRYAAKADPNAEREERAEYENLMYADILSRAIDHVETGSGEQDHTDWTPERLQAIQEKLYDPQTEKLLTALSLMVYTGGVFEGSLTSDF